MKILIVDCYDSFTYNLFHAIEKVGDMTPSVVRVDDCTKDLIASFEAIVFSPGPGLPEETFDLIELVSYAAQSKPVLGICLGHQAIAQSFGGSIYRQNRPWHGVARRAIQIENPEIFAEVPQHFDAGSYHSWSVNKFSVLDYFRPEAEDEHGDLLAMKHVQLPVWGLQFHPESVLTPQGEIILKNWVNLANRALNKQTTG